MAYIEMRNKALTVTLTATVRSWHIMEIPTGKQSNPLEYTFQFSFSKVGINIFGYLWTKSLDFRRKK
jgi:hypothetical protein